MLNLNFSFNEYLPIYTIFILVLIVSAKYIPDIIPCKIQRFMEGNIYFRHLLTFFTMILFVILITPLKDQKVLEMVLKSIALYIIFLFYVKSNYIVFAIVTVISLILYLSMLFKYQLEAQYKESQDENEKKNIENEINIMITINNIVFGLIILLIIFGFLLYLGEKKLEYKKNFSYITFFLGKIECSNKNFKKFGIKNSLKSALIT